MSIYQQIIELAHEALHDDSKQEELYLLLKEQIRQQRDDIVMQAMEAVPDENARWMLYDYTKYITASCTVSFADTPQRWQAHLVAVNVSVVFRSEPPLAPSHLRYPDIQHLEDLMQGDVRLPARTRLMLAEGLLKPETLNQLTLHEIADLTRNMAADVSEGRRGEPFPDRMVARAPRNDSGTTAHQYLLVGLLSCAEADPRTLVEPVFDNDWACLIREELADWLERLGYDAMVDVMPMQGFYETMENGKVRTGQFEVIYELLEVFERHHVDLDDLMAIIYTQDPTQLRASIIYRPGNQILAGIQRNIPHDVMPERLVTETVEIFQQAGFGATRVAPHQDAEQGFLTPADLGPKPLRQYL
jgi:hypothetical protein